MTEGTNAAETVVVHVTFAAASRPYNHNYSRTATIADVIRDAIASFGIHTDGTTRYYLVFASVEQPDGETLGSLAETDAEHSGSLKLSLRTETISG